MKAKPTKSVQPKRAKPPTTPDRAAGKRTSRLKDLLMDDGELVGDLLMSASRDKKGMFHDQPQAEAFRASILTKALHNQWCEFI